MIMAVLCKVQINVQWKLNNGRNLCCGWQAGEEEPTLDLFSPCIFGDMSEVSKPQAKDYSYLVQIGRRL